MTDDDDDRQTDGRNTIA